MLKNINVKKCEILKNNYINIFAIKKKLLYLQYKNKKYYK